MENKIYIKCRKGGGCNNFFDDSEDLIQDLYYIHFIFLNYNFYIKIKETQL